jgi:hypothetical protein
MPLFTDTNSLTDWEVRGLEDLNGYVESPRSANQPAYVYCICIARFSNPSIIACPSLATPRRPSYHIRDITFI